VPGHNPRNNCYQGENAERDDETGYVNFDLRMYDSDVARWFVPDPMHQHFSPYMAMGNNPVSGTDATGGEDYESNEIGEGGGAAYGGLRGGSGGSGTSGYGGYGNGYSDYSFEGVSGSYSMSSYSVQSGSNYSGSYNENDENNENGSTEENYVTSGKSYGGDNVEGSSGKQGTSMDDIIDAAKGMQGDDLMAQINRYLQAANDQSDATASTDDISQLPTGEKASTSRFTARGYEVSPSTLLMEFLTGTGPEYSLFEDGHPMVEELKNSFIVSEAMIKMLVSGEDNLIGYNAPFGLVNMGISYTLTEQFIGGARVSIIPVQAGGYTIIVVDNTTGLYSGAYHQAQDINRVPGQTTPGGNIYQRFIWTIK
jgi:RHS repeat-associated protein